MQSLFVITLELIPSSLPSEVEVLIMSTATQSGSHIESAVPTLKVMRLQKPDLHIVSQYLRSNTSCFLQLISQALVSQQQALCKRIVSLEWQCVSLIHLEVRKSLGKKTEVNILGV